MTIEELRDIVLVEVERERGLLADERPSRTNDTALVRIPSRVARVERARAEGDREEARRGAYELERMAGEWMPAESRLGINLIRYGQRCQDEADGGMRGWLARRRPAA